MIKMRFMDTKAGKLNSLINNQEGEFQIATGLLARYRHGTSFARSNHAGAEANYVCQNSSFKSAEGALLARRLNVPSVLISLAARRNAPHAARARPEPTEMRRTPRSTSCDTVS